MKVIDLLNKIAKGEEVPQKIKVGNKIYNYETFNIGKGDNYFTAEWGEVKGYRISYDGTYYYLEIRDYNLNDEVEIIEKDKKIEKVNTYVLCDSDFERMGVHSLKATEIIDKAFEEYSHKINEIIDKINEDK